jgi:hypothetical protein
MAHSQIACGYKVTAQGGQTIATLATELAAVPLDLTIPTLFGLLPIKDQTVTVGQSATRTITLQMAPAVPAFAAATLVPGSPKGPIETISLGNSEANGDYAAPPIITFTGAQEHKARAVAIMCLVDAIIVNPGSGYTGAATATVVGGQVAPASGVLNPGRVALAQPSFIGGAVSGITYLDIGTGYNSFPQIVINDVPGGGSGAIVFGGLTVLALQLYDPGVYLGAPGMVFTPAFQASNPDTSDQRTAVSGFMTRAFEESMRSQVTALIPVVT